MRKTDAALLSKKEKIMWISPVIGLPNTICCAGNQDYHLSCSRWVSPNVPQRFQREAEKSTVETVWYWMLLHECCKQENNQNMKYQWGKRLLEHRWASTVSKQYHQTLFSWMNSGYVLHCFCYAVKPNDKKHAPPTCLACTKLRNEAVKLPWRCPLCCS